MPRSKDPLAFGDPAKIRTSAPPRRAVGMGQTSQPRDLGVPELLTLAEFARLVRRHPRTVRGWVRDGVVPVVRVGRATLVPRAVVTATLFRSRPPHVDGTLDHNTEQVNSVSTQTDTSNTT